MIINFNSFLLTAISLHKLGFCVKSFSIISGILYANVCWQLVGERAVLESIVKEKNNLIGYWHR
jgi:hypothetical protein